MTDINYRTVTNNGHVFNIELTLSCHDMKNYKAIAENCGVIVLASILQSRYSIGLVQSMSMARIIKEEA